MFRRTLLTTSAALLASTACTVPPGSPPGTAPTITLSSAAAFGEGILNTLAGGGDPPMPGVLQAIAAAAPNLIPPAVLTTLLKDLSDAASLLANITPDMLPPAGASTLQQVEIYFNDVMAIIVPILPMIPGGAAFVLPVDAAMIAIRLIEQFVNSQIPAVAPAGAVTARIAGLRPNARAQLASATAAAQARGMTPAKAAAQLGVKWP